MPCSGKSTLLRQSLESGISVFGEPHDDLFKSTRIPPAQEENHISLDERLKNNYWLHEVDLLRAKDKNVTLESSVIHFDIYWFYINMLSRHLQLSGQGPVQEHQIIDDAAMRSIFGLVKFLLPPQSAFAIKILEAQYEDVCDRWHYRLSSNGGKYAPRQEFLHRHIYNKSFSGKKVYERLIQSFKSCF